jgi:predicted membrane chloride channel (bestrophin family)
MSRDNNEQNPWSVLCQVRGSVWGPVFPFCLLNVLNTWLVALAKQHHISIAFSPEGHGLVGLLVSFLVINKMYLALDRYMQSRAALGLAFASLRELHQLVLVFTAQKQQQQQNQQQQNAVQEWRAGTRDRIVHLLECTVRVLTNDNGGNNVHGNRHSTSKDDLAAYLSRNEGGRLSHDNAKNAYDHGDDPMVYAQLLRLHVYNGGSNGSDRLPVRLELLERTKLVDAIHTYLFAYQELLKFASTPLPFPMIQMARTFLFIWIFSMPLALVGLELKLGAVMIFIFFLTYGYVGLELVSVILLDPFGDDVNSLNIVGMKDATIVGMENDAALEQLPLLHGGTSHPLQSKRRSVTKSAVDDGYRILQIDKSTDDSGYLQYGHGGYTNAGDLSHP